MKSWLVFVIIVTTKVFIILNLFGFCMAVFITTSGNTCWMFISHTRYCHGSLCYLYTFSARWIVLCKICTCVYNFCFCYIWLLCFAVHYYDLMKLRYLLNFECSQTLGALKSLGLTYGNLRYLNTFVRWKEWEHWQIVVLYDQNSWNISKISIFRPSQCDNAFVSCSLLSRTAVYVISCPNAFGSSVL